MVLPAGDIDKVRASNEGHAFHVVWAARRCLILLDPLSDLRAVGIEAISPHDTATAKEATLKSDTTEYYGGEGFEEARKIVRAQLKYSPSDYHTPWPASGIAETFGAFAQDFEEKCSKYGEAATQEKLEYLFVTNRPISENVKKALLAACEGRQETGHVKNALNSLKAAAKLSDSRFRVFSSLFRLQSNEASRSGQEWALRGEISQYLPGYDTIAPLNLEKLVRDKGLLTDNKKPVRRHDVLAAFHVSEGQLLPAPPSKAYKLPEKYIPRAQEREIAEKIIEAKSALIIHAYGGVGKSTLALRLPALMPDGSESVVFDGFADGLYRDPSNPRHKYDRGLVQIVNEFSFRGLCDPLLPSASADRGQYIAAFLNRLTQVAATIRQFKPDALVLVVLDAADNSQMGAGLEVPNAQSFTQSLLNVQVPAYCRLVFISRTERVTSHLNPAPFIEQLPLHSFELSETAQLLRSHYPEVSDQTVREFHRMSSANPRVQANAISSGSSLQDMMSSFGPNPLGVEDAISYQLQKAVAKVKVESASPTQIDTLCIALAALPPLVPIKTLAQAANVSEALVRSFISDIGRYLMELDGALHFRDEPVDTWFRDNFAKPAQYLQLVNELESQKSDPYVAMALPELLWQAGQIGKLMSLASGDEALPTDNPVEKRRIVMRRVHFALKAAVKENLYLDVVKLAIRAGEEAAGNSREIELLLDNHDLVATIFGAKRAQEVVFRHHASEWMGSGFAYGASILAGDEACQGEARNMLRCAEEWLNHWADLSQEEKKAQPIDTDDRSAMALAHLMLHGPEEMVAYLLRWTYRPISFHAGSPVISRLIDAGHFDLVDQIASLASKKSLYLSLALANEVGKISRIPPEKAIQKALSLLFRAKKIKREKNSFEPDNILDGIISLIEAGAQIKTSKKPLLSLLDRYMPEIPQYGYSSDHSRGRDAILRFNCLKAVLEGKEIKLLDIAPDKIKEIPESQREHNSDFREFKEVIGTLIHWYALRARIITQDNVPVQDEVDRILALTKNYRGYDHPKSRVVNEIAPLWLDILVRSQTANTATINQLEAWLTETKVFIFIPRKTAMTRTMARYTPAHEKAYDFAKGVKDDSYEYRGDAAQRAECYTNLARAMLALSKNEAAAYFGDALEAVNRFGDELINRWESITSLAAIAGEVSGSNPELAYKYARAAEVVSDHVPDHFPWNTVICNVAKICPASGFAVLSRWLDRDKGWIREMLPSLTLFLLKSDLISPEAAFSLLSFKGRWDIGEFFDVLFYKAKQKEYMFQHLVRDVSIHGKWEEASELKVIADKYGLPHEDLQKIISFHKEKGSRDRQSNNDYPPAHRESPVVDWGGIIGGKSFTNTAEIDAAVRELKKFKPYWPIQELFSRMLAQVPRDQEVFHLRALANSSELEFWSIISALEDAKLAWHNRASVQNGLRAVCLDLIESRIQAFCRSIYSLEKDLEKMGALGSISNDELMASLLKGLANNVEKLNASNLFVAAHKISRMLPPEDAVDALEYALGRVDIDVRDTDADGPWHEDLAPPSDMDSAAAAFIYALLANPEAKLRWQAAHCVVHLCRLKASGVVAELVKLMDIEALPAFTDRTLTFYSWHSRLYLMIALARAAKEVPDFLVAHTNIFLQWSLKPPHHALIQEFSAQAALAIGQAYPDIISANDISLLKAVNVSQHTPEPPKKPTGWNMSAWRSTGFYFPHDFDRYWIGPLSTAFNLSYEETAQPISDWAIKEGKNKTTGKWDEDPRKLRGDYEDENTRCDGGCYPEVDTLSFYLSYHAIFSVAAGLLATKPTAVLEAWQQSWAKWLRGHLLTREDGFWLADRRDAVPMENRRWQKETINNEVSKEWKWQIISADFDDALFIGGSLGNDMVLRGSWSVSEGSLVENISISSAAISPSGSVDLLRRLQTSINHHDYFVPDDDEEFMPNEHKMYGWASVRQNETGLDKLDLLSGKVSWPGLQPSKRTRRLLRLKLDPDQRIWRQDESPVLFSQVWGGRREHRHEQAANYGERLIANASHLLDNLQRLKQDLIIQVEIRREDGKKDNIEYFDRNYTRVYLLKHSGELCTLHGSRFLCSKK